MLISLVGAGLVLAAALAYASLTRDLPSIETLPRLLNSPDGLLLQPTRVYDRTGENLLLTFAPFETPRNYLPMVESTPKHIPKIFPQAVVAVIDPQFWRHSGYSSAGIDNPDIHSTIAQRLADELLLYDEAPSIRRALRERLLAAQITSRYGRDQVLEWYLNCANYGRYAFGIDSAAQYYFGKSAADLSLAESAMLAGVLEAPALNPADAPAAALQRGREVIHLLEALEIVDSAQAVQALAEDPRPLPEVASKSPIVHGQGVEAFINLAMNQLSTRYDRDRIERGGLKVLMTVDYELQKATICSTETLASRLSGLPVSNEECEAAGWLPSLPPGVVISDSSISALILDPGTGQVLAIAGETNQGVVTPLFSEHDPGSLMDIFVYLTGFTRGMSPATLVWDIPGQVESQNIEGQYHGPVRLRIALANGYRTPAANMRIQLGIENVSDIARSFGIQLDAPTGLQNIAGAFGVFTSQGVNLGQNLGGDTFSPSTVLRIESLDGTQRLDWSVPQSKAVVSRGLAYLMTHALSDESARRLSLGSPNPLEIDRPLGVMLGQNDSGLDAWSVGYTPNHVVVVWAGTHSDKNLSPHLPSVLLSGLIQYASRNLSPDDWPTPEDVTILNVCDPSGLLPTQDCPNVVREVFLVGSEPHQSDPLFRKFSINRETGLLATVFTPPQLVEERLYMVVPPEARAWAESANVPLPPDSYDAIQPPVLDPEVRITLPVLFSEVSGLVKITGTAAGEDFESYRLLAGKGLNPQEWIEITSGDQQVADGLLGEWDTHGLSGLYALELTVTRTDQNVATAVTQVTISGESQ
jgi:membrane peptidoglycan carboxypeptidase